ncbi:unnamed protein product [Protopolystoma xenopodis]|uniref:Striatin N-terminal domain-containing protein n=1 Tax=Protopolystoma xenopodis TaxID=117903 RepID=A0A448XEK4_9PLAT|nr:unnamed protein product [Protopolystoma xenopodis]
MPIDPIFIQLLLVPLLIKPKEAKTEETACQRASLNRLRTELECQRARLHVLGQERKRLASELYLAGAERQPAKRSASAFGQTLGGKDFNMRPHASATSSGIGIHKGTAVFLNIPKTALTTMTTSTTTTTTTTSGLGSGRSLPVSSPSQSKTGLEIKPLPQRQEQFELHSQPKETDSEPLALYLITGFLIANASLQRCHWRVDQLQRLLRHIASEAAFFGLRLLHERDQKRRQLRSIGRRPRAPNSQAQTGEPSDEKARCRACKVNLELAGQTKLTNACSNPSFLPLSAKNEAVQQWTLMNMREQDEEGEWSLGTSSVSFDQETPQRKFLFNSSRAELTGSALLPAGLDFIQHLSNP